MNYICINNVLQSFFTLYPFRLLMQYLNLTLKYIHFLNIIKKKFIPIFHYNICNPLKGINKKFRKYQVNYNDEQSQVKTLSRTQYEREIAKNLFMILACFLPSFLIIIIIELSIAVAQSDYFARNHNYM